MKRCSKGSKPKKDWLPNGYIFAALRRIFRWSPSVRQALKSAQTDEGKFTCNACRRTSFRDGVAVDHREPVVDPVRGFGGWDDYVARLFVTADKLQILCKPCHKIKTQEENKIRRARKKAA